MPVTSLQAQSVAEIQYYLRITVCERCGKGPLRCDQPLGAEGSPALPNSMTLSCAACDASWVQPIDSVPASASEPSRIIDLGQWLVLVSLLMHEAGQETHRVRIRELGISAGTCLGEALKFYADADNDLPPPEAFFHEESRKRFHDSPEKFSRRRIAGIKANLPQPYEGH